MLVRGCRNVRKKLPLSRFLTNAVSPREQMHYDVVTVGGGPAGLSAAIRLKQLAKEQGTDLSVCVIDKGGEIGAHVLSGNVFESRALGELFPNWKDMGAPLGTKVREDRFLVLTGDKGSISIPSFLQPPQLHNDGNYIISLSQLCRWLAKQAEDLGVEIYPGFAASEVIYDSDSGAVRGVATRDSGISKVGVQKDSYTPGVELLGRQTLFAEGCRGSCSEDLIAKFKLREGKDEQTYGLGIKEVWKVPKENFQEGLVQHTLGWPLQSNPFSKTFGGTFLYHQAPDLVLVGMVVGLDYANPYLSPYREFQRWKHHPEIAHHLRGGECIAYGARTLNEGGWHSIPKLTFPGGALVGCGAGFLNAVKIKGSHTAMKSGMLAAEAIYPLLTARGAETTVALTGSVDNCKTDQQSSLTVGTGTGKGEAAAIEAVSYEQALQSSWIAEELKEIRNTHAAFHYGLLAGMAHTALSCFITKGKEPWSLHNFRTDASATQPAAKFSPLVYPKPDGVLSFDLLTNLQRSGTTHEHDQPAHLRIKPHLAHIPSQVSIKIYAGPEQRFCPAQVYEYTEAGAGAGEGGQQLIINAQNCLHCKACSIKTHQQFVQWTVPEGGGGPAYQLM